MKIVCAYSGGLDTSVMVRWLKERYDAEIVTYTGDLGQGDDLPAIRAKALRTGASHAVVDDLRERFAHEFLLPALQANARYEGLYPMATSLGRPLLAQRLVEVAEEVGATAIAHGCTGKGNDQVRFEIAAQTLAPGLKVIAPLREWELTTREMEVDYAREHGIDVPVTRENPWSIDQNLWGCAIEAGSLEDLWNAPPEAAYQMTRAPESAAGRAEELVLRFERGVPVAIDGAEMGLVALIESLNRRAGAFGIGRIDMVENRVVGLKSREVYEAPGATVLLLAHEDLERVVLDGALTRYKRQVGLDFADLVYQGLWFSPLREALAAFVRSTQERVSGEVRLRLTPGQATVVGRRSGLSLYDHGLATYGDGDVFDRTAAAGFLKLYGLPYRTWGAVGRRER